MLRGAIKNSSGLIAETSIAVHVQERIRRNLSKGKSNEEIEIILSNDIFKDLSQEIKNLEKGKKAVPFTFFAKYKT